MKIDELEKVDVGIRNTPIEYMPYMTEYLKGAELYIKRDDLSGLALGGNKTRKLDYIVKYALNNGYTTLMTYGGVQTNHGRLTVAAAKKFGLKSILVLKGAKPDYMSGNILLDRLMGTEMYFVDTSSLDGPDKDKKAKEFLRECAEKIIADKERQGEKVLDIPVGGQTIIGAAGYIQAAKEIMEQTEKMGISPDYVVCGYGSTGTFSGLWAGAKHYNAPFKVIGIPIEPDYVNPKETAEFINQISKFYGFGFKCGAEDLDIEAGPKDEPYGGTGYNLPDEVTWEFVKLMAEKEAVILDPCYTGKVFHGFADLVKSGKIEKNKTALFVNTGGSPGLWGKEQLDFANGLFWKDFKAGGVMKP
jgi:1-aminocyclopropane-1-carboxylate deaminase/D-cysteine desulfhydrase-like pyridoxal-dependent ACC family enzyme